MVLSDNFYLARAGDGVIGFDGCGALDYDRSDLTRSVIESGRRLATRMVAKLDPSKAEAKITMRRAVRLFDFFYDYQFNTLMVSPDAYADHRLPIDTSVQSLSLVTCHFGQRSAPYYFGNLKNENCLKECVWSKSSFATVYTSHFDINQTEIGRHEVPLDHEVPYVARDQVFEDMQEYWRTTPSLHKHLPLKLAFAFPYQAILNVGVGRTLISAALFEALWNRKRPKSRVLGMTGSRPLVEVTFGETKPT
jgi:hypothetical protein